MRPTGPITARETPYELTPGAGTPIGEGTNTAQTWEPPAEQTYDAWVRSKPVPVDMAPRQTGEIVGFQLEELRQLGNMNKWQAYGVERGYVTPQKDSFLDKVSGAINTIVPVIVAAGIGYGGAQVLGLVEPGAAVAGPAPGAVAGEGVTIGGAGGVSGGAGFGGGFGGAGTAAAGTGAVDYAAANAALTAPAAGVDFAGAASALTAPVGAPAAGLMSKVGTALKGASAWLQANPIPTLIGGQILAQSLTPDQVDLMEQQREYQLQDIDRANANVSGVANLPKLQYTGASPYGENVPNFLKRPPAERGLMARKP